MEYIGIYIPIYWNHICGIQKNGVDDLICKAEIETQTQRTNVWTPSGERGGWDEMGAWD